MFERVMNPAGNVGETPNRVGLTLNNLALVLGDSCLTLMLTSRRVTRQMAVPDNLQDADS